MDNEIELLTKAALTIRTLSKELEIAKATNKALGDTLRKTLHDLSNERQINLLLKRHIPTNGNPSKI